MGNRGVGPWRRAARHGRLLGVPRLPQADARRLLTTVPVARLATVDETARPHLVPVTFAVHRGTVYTAVDHKPKSTRDLRRLANIRANPRVALLADHYEDDWDRLWWVRVDGRAGIVEDPARTAEPVRLLADRYAQYRDRPPEGPVIAIAIDAWSGWSAS
ncbi:TIGR03668 family PPOX class F420-dependent oxidoreductase [Actinomadura rubrisoli]|uniref:TIGR03668 family PPOX class F420-dependent oxidoreductase n=1 Tax=Actinomadura rubrisoli TaxID=2530368 RepID=A0A4R5BUF1_9ACTN|nr:TIGR03668 family PPOX class F420-dependent oxidoreductase [Actinomadura rubrisoli]TDD88950.1 TIGR03668 family PPOX class F420-dependent oxidoreductase [Actinomadura rubrisoli]